MKKKKKGVDLMSENISPSDLYERYYVIATY